MTGILRWRPRPVHIRWGEIDRGYSDPYLTTAPETPQHAENDQIALSMDTNIVGGLFVKGYIFNAAQFKDCKSAPTSSPLLLLLLLLVVAATSGPTDCLTRAPRSGPSMTPLTPTHARTHPRTHARTVDAACTKGNLVLPYEWGYGSCDDYMVATKANAAQTTFTATVTANPDGSGSKLTASEPLKIANAGQGLYVVFENLLGAPSTFSNAQVTVNGKQVAEAGKPLEFPAATVHMSAAVVKLGDHTMVDGAQVTFDAKGTAPTQAARPTALMVLNEDQLAADKLGCTMAFYFGWVKKNEVGLNVCKGFDFSLTQKGDVLTLDGTVKYIPSDKKAELLKGDIQVDPAYTLFQGDGAYSFAAAQNGARGVAVLVPNRLDTPITLENLKVEYESTLAGLLGGPIAGIVVAVLVAVAALMGASYCFGKKRAAAAQVGQKGTSMV